LAKLTYHVKCIRKCRAYLRSGTKEYPQQLRFDVRSYDERSRSKIPKFSILTLFKKNQTRLTGYPW